MTSCNVSVFDTLRQRCTPVLGQQELSNVQWAGVFGSYARNEQQEDSDIDILIGFKNGTSWPDVYQMVYILNRELREAMDRDVDILYMRNMEIRGFIMLEAILQAKTVYGDDSWLFANRPPAMQYLVNGHWKLQTALSLQREVLRLWESVTAKSVLLPENATTKTALIRLLGDLCDALSFGPDERPFRGYCSTVSNWILNDRSLIQRIKNSNSEETEAADVMALWSVLDRELATHTKYLENVYLPIVAEVMDHAQR